MLALLLSDLQAASTAGDAVGTAADFLASSNQIPADGLWSASIRRSDSARQAGIHGSTAGAVGTVDTAAVPSAPNPTTALSGNSASSPDGTAAAIIERDGGGRDAGDGGSGSGPRRRLQEHMRTSEKPPPPYSPPDAPVLVPLLDFLPLTLMDVALLPGASSGAANGKPKAPPPPLPPPPHRGLDVVVLACGPAAGAAAAAAAAAAPAAAGPTSRCVPVCASPQFTDAEAALVCRSLGVGPGGSVRPATVAPGTAAGVGAGAAAELRPGLAELTCPAGSDDVAACVAYLQPSGCRSFATLRCKTGPPSRQPRPPPSLQPPAVALPAFCANVRQRLTALSYDASAFRTDLPHGTLQLLDGRGAAGGQAGVVQLSYCGYTGTLSMRSRQLLVAPARGSKHPQPRVLQPQNVHVANTLRASVVCTALGFENSRYKKGSQRFNGGRGVVWEMTPVCGSAVVTSVLGEFLNITKNVGGKPWQTLQVPANSCSGYKLDVSFDPHDFDLSVQCWNRSAELVPPPYVRRPDDPYQGALRLMNHTREAWRSVAPGASSGYLQVFKDGVWGSICSTGWDDADAAVACRQLGFATGSALYLKYDVALPNDNAGSRWRHMWMTDVACPPTSPPRATAATTTPAASPPLLLDCPHRGPPITDCPYTELAAVRCYASARRVPPPPPMSPPPPPRPPRTCPFCLFLDLTMDPPIGRDQPTMGPAMCARLAAVFNAVVLTLAKTGPSDIPGAGSAQPTSSKLVAPPFYPGAGAQLRRRPPPPPRPSPPPAATQTLSLLGFSSPAFDGLLAAQDDGRRPPPASALLPEPFRCVNFTGETMRVCGRLGVGWREGERESERKDEDEGEDEDEDDSAAEALLAALDGQNDDQRTEWLRELRDRIGLLQPCQTFDVDYDYRMAGNRMTPDVTFTSSCDGESLTYVGMDGVNTLVRNVWQSPPPDAPWAAGGSSSGGGTAGRAPPPRSSPPPPPPPLPPPPAATPAATLLSCFSLLAPAVAPSPASPPPLSVALGPAADVSPLLNVTSSGLSLTLAACMAAGRAAGRTHIAVEGYSALIPGVGIRLTAVCYGLNWQERSPASAAALSELAAFRCSTVPCAGGGGAGGPPPACGTGRAGGFALYDLGRR